MVRKKTISKLVLSIDFFPTGARFYTALDNCMQRSDQMEVELQRDIESARMFRYRNIFVRSKHPADFT